MTAHVLPQKKAIDVNRYHVTTFLPLHQQLIAAVRRTLPLVIPTAANPDFLLAALDKAAYAPFS